MLCKLLISSCISSVVHFLVTQVYNSKNHSLIIHAEETYVVMILKINFHLLK